MNQYRLPVSIAAITSEFVTKYFKAGEILIGSYLIKIQSLDSALFYPIAIVSDFNLYIKIADKYISIPIKKISYNKIENEILNIKWDKDSIQFGLLKSDLKNIDNDYTTLFSKLIETIKNEGVVDQEILNNLPDQSKYLSSTKKTLLILISALFMLTIGFFLSGINFNLSFLLFVGGILLILYLAVRFILRVDS